MIRQCWMSYTVGGLACSYKGRGASIMFLELWKTWKWMMWLKSISLRLDSWGLLVKNKSLTRTIPLEMFVFHIWFRKKMPVLLSLFPFLLNVNCWHNVPTHVRTQGRGRHTRKKKKNSCWNQHLFSVFWSSFCFPPTQTLLSIARTCFLCARTGPLLIHLMCVVFKFLASGGVENTNLNFIRPKVNLGGH